jgi:hypothetical protein
VATDDIKVGLKVVLDEASVAKEVQEAEAALNRGKSSTKGGQQGTTAVSIGEALKITVTKPLVDKLSQIEAKLTGTPMGGAVGGLPGGAGLMKAIAVVGMVVLILEALYQAIKAVVTSVWNLAQSLARFSPILSVAFRELQIAMRIISIRLAHELGPILAVMVRDIREIIYTLVELLLPSLKVLIYVIVGLVRAFRDMLRSVVLFTAGLLRVVADLMRTFPVLNVALFGLADQLDVASNKLMAFYKGLVGGTGLNQNGLVAQMNQALIRGFSELGKQASPGVAPSSGERDAPNWSAPLKVEGLFGTKSTGKPPPTSVAAGRTSVSMQPPSLASIVNNVQLKAEVKLQHEEAVQRSIEEVRGLLVRAIHSVRNEQHLLSSKIYARTVIDL